MDIFLLGRFDRTGAETANAGDRVLGVLFLRHQVAGEQCSRAAQARAAVHTDAELV